MANLKLLVIHCTDTPAFREVSAAEIRDWHLKGNGWRQVGYTDMIHVNGGVERLVENNEDDVVDSWEVTNGARGHNQHARHIVYVGGKGGDTRTAAQKNALKMYVLDFVKKHPGIKVCGHSQLDSGKTCPSFDVPNWLRSIGVAAKNIY
jgi:hypothetical protein